MRGWVLIGCVILAGCRGSIPDLKPPKTAECLVEPPQGDRRYDYPIYPKEAMANTNDRKKDTGMQGPPNMPMGGGMMPGAMMQPGGR
jgi:hypothetical protein